MNDSDIAEIIRAALRRQVYDDDTNFVAGPLGDCRIEGSFDLESVAGAVKEAILADRR